MTFKFSSNKDLNNIIQYLVKKGWTYTHGSKHGKIKHPSGKILVVSKSPSDHRVIKNFIRDLKYLESNIH